MDVLCTFRIKIESQNLDQGCTKDQWQYQNQDPDAKPQSGTSRVLQSPYQDLKDMDVLCTFKIKIESQNSEYVCAKDHWPYPNQDPDAISQSGASSPHKSPNPDLNDKDDLWPSISFQRAKMQNVGLSKTTCHNPGTLKDSMLFWEEESWLKLKFVNWASLSDSLLNWGCS